MAATMLIGQFGGSGSMPVKAEDTWTATEYVVNGDLETGDVDGWSIELASWENAGYTAKVDSWAVNNKTTMMNIWNDTVDGNALTIRQTITAIPAGTYRLSFDQEGEKMSSGLSVSVADTSKTLPATTGWDVWAEVTTDAFTLTEAGDVTIIISGNLPAGYWGDFDNFVLEKAVSSTDESGDKGEKADTFSASDDNYTVEVTVDNAAPEAGDTVAMSAKVTAADGTEVTDLQSAGIALWWWTDTWNDHADGLGDASYSNWDDNSGYSLTADVTLPSVGTYYIIGQLEYSGTKLPVVIPMSTTEAEPDENPGTGEDGDTDDDVDTSVAGEINVEKIKNLPEDFIMGMDISSVMSEFASGVTYKDFEGNTIDNITDFCEFLAENGITHIRVRVWNDPFDTNGNGYGGGNCDVTMAAKIAEGCRTAGLKMLIDFHCSDFWADPGKQQAPKAWSGYTLEEKEAAVKEFIQTALETIDPERQTVDMVQVGNETTGGFVGVYDTEGMCKLFQAGAEAVHIYNEEAKVVIHVTNPEKGRVTTWAKNLNTYSVAYDVLATSYYPYWHGTLANLESELAKVKDTYGKDTMVAETSYAYTLEDSDGHDNTVRVGNNDSGSNTLQPFSVQGQATAIRNVMETVNNAGGLGVFYWEPAWITVGDTTGLSGDVLDAQVEANKAVWEANGSGWASSFAGEYDAKDAGKWYGGSAVDNEAMFYPDGTPTAALYVWNYVKTGAVSRYASVEGLEQPETTIDAGAEFTLPATITVTYNDGEKEEPVVWDAVETEAIDTSVSGTYTVNGTVTFSKEINQGTYAGQTTAGVVYTLHVKQSNLIADAEDAGFESGANYTVGGKGISGIPAKDDPYAGKGSMHWYYTSETTGTVTYNPVLTLEPGNYSAEIMAQGYAGDKVSLQILSANEEVLFEGEAAVLEGWAVWKTAAVNFSVTEQTEVKLRVVVDMQAGGWGTADELYLYKSGDIDTDTDTDKDTDTDTDTDTNTDTDPDANAGGGNSGNQTGNGTASNTTNAGTKTQNTVAENANTADVGSVVTVKQGTEPGTDVSNTTQRATAGVRVAEERDAEEALDTEEEITETPAVEDTPEAVEEQQEEVTAEIAEDEVPLAADTAKGGKLPIWPIPVAVLVFGAFAGTYVFAKKKKMIK